jgi:FkbM family methyltransferase
MNDVVKAVRKLVNSGPLREAKGLRRMIKSVGIGAANLVSKGATVEVAKGRHMVVPWDLVGATRWEDYEPVSMDLCARFIEQHPDALVIDVGCSIGIFSCMALHLSDRTEVFSLDADLMSLTMAKKMGSTASGQRHNVIWGFCTDPGRSGANALRADLPAATKRSNEVLVRAGLKPSIGANKYTCIDGNEPKDTPSWDLDFLFAPIAQTGRPMLVKIDIEGAEAIAMQGTSELMKLPNVEFIIGVHPGRLPGFGTTRDELWKLIEDRGCEVELVETDTEEHWWVRRSGEAAVACGK